MTLHRIRNERGLTLLEMMIALVVFSFVLAGALAFLRAQGRSFTLGSQRVAMLQNARFAFDELDKDLRTAGAGAPDIQPQLIYIAGSVVAFNANYLTNTPGDVFAVYYNPDAPNGSTDAVGLAQRFTIPLTTVLYPDTNYLEGVTNSASETITFFFAPDTTTTRTDDYTLYRQINNLAPEVVSRNLMQTGTTPFFQYYWQTVVGGVTSVAQVPNAGLPWQHTVPIHLAVTDSGPAARIDSVRAVLVSFTVTNGLSGTAERRRALSRYIRLPNVGIANRQTCGDVPILGSAVTATWNAATLSVDLTWNAAVDETGGERDVTRYVIFRRLVTDLVWGDPYFSVAPAGTATYKYPDGAVSTGAQYVYGLAAQDCTPTNSTLSSSAPITIP
jgi:prepilin-type N-terminal cleavage/methylation domain-containing protein